MDKIKKYSVKVNSIDKLEQLLQETYNLACQQYITLQNEINKMANSTVINNLDIDGKDKYAKIISNYTELQQKSIKQKYDIAKLLAEVLKHKGDVNSAIDASKGNVGNFSMDAIKNMLKSNSSEDETIEYQTNK